MAGALATGNGDDGAVFTALFFFMLGAIPTSVGVAVLRYRLYDIDRVINRTLVYGVLTLLLAGAYAAITLLLGTGLGSGSAWPTAVATLLVAVAFRPLRARVQDAVDRRFSRARYDARTRIVGFLEDLRAGRAAPEAVEPLLREVLSDPRLELRFFLPESELYVDARGRPAGRPGRRTVACERRSHARGSRSGWCSTARVDEGRPGLLEEVVEAAGLAIEIARLRVELRRQLDEVEASRARIVAAGYEERRRLERDLHDGAQQRLISIGLALRHAQHELGDSPEKAGESIDGAVREIDVAAGELQELARGVRPAQLDAGLTPGPQGACRPRPAARPGQGERRALPAGARGRGLLHRERGADQRRQAFSGSAGHVERGAVERNARDLDLATTGSAAPHQTGAAGCEDWLTGRQPTAARSRSRASETTAPSSPWSCRASSDRGGPGAPAGGPRAALRGRRA